MGNHAPELTFVGEYLQEVRVCLRELLRSEVKREDLPQTLPSMALTAEALRSRIDVSRLIFVPYDDSLHPPVLARAWRKVSQQALTQVGNDLLGRDLEQRSPGQWVGQPNSEAAQPCPDSVSGGGCSGGILL